MPPPVPTLILAAALAAIAVIDARELRVPDILSLPLIAAGISWACAFGGEGFVWHAAGAAAGYALIWALAALYRRARGREGIGLGDAKLLAAGGAWLGLAALPAVLLVASLVGLAWAAVLKISTGFDSGRPVPFGLFLAGAILLIWLTGAPGAPPPWR